MRQFFWETYNKLRSLTKWIIAQAANKPRILKHFISISIVCIVVTEFTIFTINHFSTEKVAINDAVVNDANIVASNDTSAPVATQTSIPIPGSKPTDIPTNQNPAPTSNNAVIQNTHANTTLAAAVSQTQPADTIITVKKRDNLSKIFIRLGLKSEDAKTILKSPGAKPLRSLHAGQKITFSLNNNQLNKISVPLNITDTLTVTKNKDKFQYRINHIEPTSHIECAAFIVNGSLYASAKKANVSSALIGNLTTVLRNKVNLAKLLRNGDRVAIMYKDYYVNNKKINKNSTLIAAEYTHNKSTYKIVNFTDSSGHTNYYTSDGYALSSPFIRFPLIFKRISSPFSYNRLNPVLHVYREHTGVDLAANMGTPIKATSNGIISFAGREGGYGNVVKIKHNQYSTLYGHMLRFASGVRTGSIVHQGQVIGYVGMTGLADGPHLHYEFRVNNTPYDPVKVKLPMDEMIAQAYRSQFYKQQRKVFAQLDSLAYSYADKGTDPVQKTTNTTKKKA